MKTAHDIILKPVITENLNTVKCLLNNTCVFKALSINCCTVFKSVIKC